jgi:alkylation response protein AidB-like acyl-CoA dehydrogenase
VKPSLSRAERDLAPSETEPIVMPLSREKDRAPEDLEAFLGDPSDPSLEFSYARRLAEDEAETYPAAALALLDRWGLQRHYVPEELGGALADFERLFALIRTVARRDLTVAIGHAVSFLGAMGVWIAGNEAQKKTLAGRLLAGDRISLALTERAHGGDLLSAEASAVEHEGGYRLSGEKWLINGASRNPLVAVLARTRPSGGPRGFSLLLFDKTTVDGSYRALPKIRTLGVRAGDISGLRFEDTPLRSEALIGGPGQGFEIVLKGLQLSRLLCGALSLGAAETALRLAIDFALERRLYGDTVFNIPQSRRLLVEAWVDLLISDGLATSALRALHLVPGEASVHSATVKYLVPTLLEDALRKLSVVLGARHYLREEHASGLFQKMLRDNLLIGLFDGSTMVNLYSLALQLKALTLPSNGRNAPAPEALRSGVADLSAALPPFDWRRLSLVSDGRNCLVGALPETARVLTDLLAKEGSSDRTLAAVLPYAEELAALAKALGRAVQEDRVAPGHHLPPRWFDRARSYCLIEAATAVLQVWLANRAHRRETRGVWVVAACARLLSLLGRETSVPDHIYEELGDALLERHAAGVTPGLVPLRIPQPTAPGRFELVPSPN